MSEGRRVQYERLFNLSNYEHEKFTVGLELDEDNIMDSDLIFKAMAIQVLELEAEITRFRKAFTLRQDLLYSLGCCTSEDEKKRIKKKLRYLDLVIEDFKLEHQPRHKECKCFYCQHPEYNEAEYDD